MSNRLLRSVTQALARKRVEEELARSGAEADPRWARWVGYAVMEKEGRRLGHVARVEPDSAGGAWVDVEVELGAMDWLLDMGVERHHPLIRYHSSDVEEGLDGLQVIAIDGRPAH